MIAAIEDGYPQREIRNASYAAQLALEGGRQVVVGVNRFQVDDPAGPPLLQIDAAIEDAQVARVRAVRASRDGAAAREAIDALGHAASGDQNVVPRMLAAVRAGCTLGEIADALRAVFGTYREHPVV